MANEHEKTLKFDEGERILRRLAAEDGPNIARIAAFDADGTLWGGDLAEHHLQDLDRWAVLQAPEGFESGFAAYEAACEEDVDQGYRLGCTMLAGLTEAQMIATCERSWETHKKHVHRPVLAMMASLADQGYVPWIVSASHRWAVEAACRDLGIAENRILAGDCPVLDGVLTATLLEPYPNGPGKVAAIKAGITQQQPAIAFGNSIHDADMLDHAQVGVLVTSDASGLPEALKARAQSGDWIVWEL